MNRREKIGGFLKSPWFVILFSSVMAFLSVHLTELGVPKPTIYLLVQNLAHFQKIHCYDLGYTVYSTFFYLLGGTQGLIIGQTITYLLIGITAYSILNKIIGRESFAPTLGACLVLIYPETWLNVNRIVETNLVILLTLGFLYFLLEKPQAEFSFIQSGMIGFISAYMILTRPNLVVVLPLLMIPMSKSIKNILVAAAVGLAVLTIIPGFTTGTFYPTPQEGKLTFFHGANPYSKESLLKYYNAEQLSANPDLYKAFYAMGLEPWMAPKTSGGEIPDKKFSEIVFQYSINWIKAHPFEYLELIPIKLWTMVRPDFRGADRKSGRSRLVIMWVQILMSLILPCWLIWKIASKDSFFGPLGAAPFSLLYIIPFLLTNAEPRYRTPLDTLFLLEIVVFAFSFLINQESILEKTNRQ
jgi:hypothetical protein